MDKQFMEVMGQQMAYHEASSGRPIQLLQQNLANPGQETYAFPRHQLFLDRFLVHLCLSEDIALVVHDWGSALGFVCVSQREDAVSGSHFIQEGSGAEIGRAIAVWLAKIPLSCSDWNFPELVIMARLDHYF